jgi:hypothetical protein
VHQSSKLVNKSRALRASIRAGHARFSKIIRKVLDSAERSMPR